MKFADLHNHTKRCNHAVGECREYVEMALARGITTFGFSCHAPMSYDSHYRMQLSEVDEYLSEVRDLRDEFSGRIDIKIAFEVDFITGKAHLLESRILEAEVDYLIGSVHFLNEWGFDNPAYIGNYEGKDIDNIWREYLVSIANMAQSGHFDIVGHFDLMKIFNNRPSKAVEGDIVRTLEAIKDNDMALEINGAGLDKQIAEIYPSEAILSTAHKMEIPISFGSDAHAPQKVGIHKDKMLSLAKRVGYKKAVNFTKKQREFYEI